MKLNEQAPEQHLAILVLAGIFVFLSLVEQFKAPSEETIDVRRSGDYALTGQTLYDNPEMTWYERYLCRGYQRSSFCSYRLLHPFRDVFEQNGIHVQEGPPADNNVVDYRGPLPVNRAFRSKMLLQSGG